MRRTTSRRRTAKLDPVRLILQRLEHREAPSESLSIIAGGMLASSWVQDPTPPARIDPRVRLDSSAIDRSVAPLVASADVHLSSPTLREESESARSSKPAVNSAWPTWWDANSSDDIFGEVSSPINTARLSPMDSDSGHSGGGAVAGPTSAIAGQLGGGVAASGQMATSGPVADFGVPSTAAETRSSAASSAAGAGRGSPEHFTTLSHNSMLARNLMEASFGTYEPAELEYESSYVIDANKGVVLSEVVDNHDFSDWAVDLRSQLSGAEVTAYTWDFSEADDAENISALDEYSVQFDWDEFTGDARDEVITLTTEFAGPISQMQRFHFVVAATDSPAWTEAPTDVNTWPIVMTPDMLQYSAAEVDGPHHWTTLSDGGLSTSLTLPSYNPDVAPVQLVYNSMTADPRPIFVARYELDPNSAVSSAITAQLNIDNSEVAVYDYDTSLMNPGNFVQLAIQTDATGLSTGRHTWEFFVEKVSIASGTFTLVNNGASPYGAGWWVEGLDRIVTGSGGVALVMAGGQSLWFEDDTGGDYFSPAGDFSTLHQNGGGDWARTLADGTVQEFDSSGKLTLVTDRNGNETDFAYDSGKLRTITDPYNQVTTLSYDGNSKLDDIEDPTNRVTEITVATGLLTDATDPSGGDWAYDYDGTRLTQITDPDTNLTTITFDSLGHRVESIEEGDGAVEGFNPWQIQGLHTGGTPAAILTAAVTADFTDGRANTWSQRLDWSGFGNTMQHTDPEGNVSVQYHDANGLMWLDSDGLGRRNRYTFDEDGNIERATWADDAHDDFTYNGFGEVLTHDNPSDDRTTYVYDVNGNLTSMINALNETTSYSYDARGNVTRMSTPRPFSVYDEQRINSFTSGEQHGAAVTSNGDYVVVWASVQDGDSFGVYGQRYSFTGAKKGGEFRVNTTTTGEQQGASVAMDAEGDFVVVWQSYVQDGSDAGVYGQLYNSAGVKVGSEFQVNTYTTGYQGQPVVAMDADGDFVVAWISPQDGSASGMYGQLYDNTGAAVGSEFQINTFTSDDQMEPAIAMDADGDFVVAWRSWWQDGSYWTVAAQRYDNTGATVGSEFQVNTYTDSYQLSPSIAMNADGDFVIAWGSYGQDGDNFGIYAQRYDNAGSTVGSEFQVNTFTTGAQMAPAVAMDSGGNFVVAWESSDHDGDDFGIYAQRFDANGDPIGDEFRANTYTTSAQLYPKVGMDADGNYMLAWRSDGQDGSTHGIYGRSYRVTAETQFKYDARSRLEKVINAEGGIREFTYTDASDVWTTTDEREFTTTMTYDDMGRLLTTTLPDDDKVSPVYPVWENTYTDMGLLETQIDPLLNVTTFTYDGNGRLETVTDALDNTTTYVYDAAGNLVEITDPLLRTNTFVYDNASRQIQHIDARGNPWSTVFDAAGQVIATSDPLDRTTTYTYMATGQVETIEDFTGAYTEYGFDAGIHIMGGAQPNTELHSASPNEYSYDRTYDALNRVLTVKDGNNHTVTYTYDPAGNVASITDALSHTTYFRYDGLNRLVATIDPLGHTAIQSYDAAGNLAAVTDALGHTTAYAYDALDRASTITDAELGVTTFTYDLVGRLESLTDPVNNLTTYAYFDNGDLSGSTDPNTEETNYEYDGAHQLKAIVDRNGRRREFDYNENGQIIEEVWFDGATPVYTATYDYFEDGQMMIASDNDSTYNYDYDPDTGLLLTIDNYGTPSMPQVTMSYDMSPLGVVNSVADDQGGRVDYSYDDGLRMDGLVHSVNNTDGASVVLSYDQADRLHYIERTDAANPGPMVSTWLWYDDANRLETIQHEKLAFPDPIPLSEFNYGYDDANRLTDYDGPEGTKTFTYDDTNQLLSAWLSGTEVESFTYDANGNRESANGVSYGAPDPGNRLTTDGEYSYDYDDEGNTTVKAKTGERWEYTWDYRNRLIEVKELDGPGGSVVYDAQYTYDVFDRRIHVLEDPDGETGAATELETWTLYDGANAWADFDGNGDLTDRYLHGAGMDERYARIAANGDIAWYLTDNINSVRQVVETDGGVLDEITYTTFGTPTDTYPNGGDRFKFTGREWDAGTGQYYNRARYYGADVGRFQGEDPLGFASADPNLFQYAANHPMTAIDPSGCDERPPLETVILIAMAPPELTDPFMEALSSLGGDRRLLQEVRRFRNAASKPWTVGDLVPKRLNTVVTNGDNGVMIQIGEQFTPEEIKAGVPEGVRIHETVHKRHIEAVTPAEELRGHAAGRIMNAPNRLVLLLSEIQAHQAHIEYLRAQAAKTTDAWLRDLAIGPALYQKEETLKYYLKKLQASYDEGTLYGNSPID